MTNVKNDSLDFIGIGKLAKAIPQSVYTQSTKTVIDTFTKLIAPITATTYGLGSYIQQKFNNMIDVEKALAAYSIQNAVAKAHAKTTKIGANIITPVHPKSFVKSIEEASKETDPFLHALWVNLLAGQLTNKNFHPHFVEVLPHFSPTEAKLLISLLGRDEIGKNSSYLAFHDDLFKYWVRRSGETTLNDWDYSCILLCEFRFAEVCAPITGVYFPDDHVTILYRTSAGNAFLSAVS